MNIPDKLIMCIAETQKVCILTGAGISAESGISTFRDPGGLWSKFNPAELASIDGFMSNPKLVWEWYQYRRGIVNNSSPNAGHYSIAEMQDKFEDFTLITQNVDRLHQKAGSRSVIELHGNIIDNYCIDCKTPFHGNINSANNEVPICEVCGGLIRPAVVWFGEMLPEKALKLAYKASENCDIFFSIGTSAEVYPAANLPLVAKQSGALTVEINPNTTAISYSMDYCINSNSGEALPVILDLLTKLRGKK